MKPSKAEAEEVVEATPNDSGGTMTDGLVGYREAIRDLAAAADQLERLRESRKEVAVEVERLAVERGELVEESSKYRDDDDVSVAVISRLGVKIELQERRGLRLEGQIAAAQAELSRVQAAVLGRLGGLYRSFYVWSLERARSQLAEQLDGGVAAHILDLIASHHRSLAGVRELEIRATDAEGVRAQAGRLLDVITGESEFAVPDLTSPAPVAGAAPEAAFEMSGLWDDGVTDISALVEELRREDSSLTLVTVNQALYRKRPDLFKPREAVLAMNAPLAQPVSGEWKAPMIGSTYREEDQKVTREPEDDSVFQTLNS